MISEAELIETLADWLGLDEDAVLDLAYELGLRMMAVAANKNRGLIYFAPRPQGQA